MATFKIKEYFNLLRVFKKYILIANLRQKHLINCLFEENKTNIIAVKLPNEIKRKCIMLSETLFSVVQYYFSKDLTTLWLNLSIENIFKNDCYDWRKTYCVKIVKKCHSVHQNPRLLISGEIEPQVTN